MTGLSGADTLHLSDGNQNSYQSSLELTPQMTILPAMKKHVKVKHNELPPEAALADLIEKLYGDRTNPVLIAIGGPGGTGKSTFSYKLAECLGDACVLHLDDYKTDRLYRQELEIYGPHPKANELELLQQHIVELLENRPIEKPVYCGKEGKISSYTEFVPKKYNILEGEISTYREICDMIHFSMFIDAHWKTQLNTRINRDIEIRGYSPEKAIATFLHSNLREYQEYGAESRNWADAHLFCDEDYSLAVEAISEDFLHAIEHEFVHHEE